MNKEEAGTAARIEVTVEISGGGVLRTARAEVVVAGALGAELAVFTGSVAEGLAQAISPRPIQASFAGAARASGGAAGPG